MLKVEKLVKNHISFIQFSNSFLLLKLKLQRRGKFNHYIISIQLKKWSYI